jgi:hypothetical protein
MAWATSLCLSLATQSESFDAAPFGELLPDASGVVWQDPREIHAVHVRFEDRGGLKLRADQVRLQYWGSWWPERHLPKDREPGGGDTGWMELGNWWKYDWRDADAAVEQQNGDWIFRFRPVNAAEFPDLTDYPVAFRYTLKVRVVGHVPLPAVREFRAFTDSTLKTGVICVAWAQAGPQPRFDVFNGRMRLVEAPDERHQVLRLEVTSNPDPNTFDRTLVTVTRGTNVFTFRFDDLHEGTLFIPDFRVAILPGQVIREYATVAAEILREGKSTLRQRIAGMPEQTWRGAWESMPRRKSDIYFPMGLDGGRQRFRLQPDGSVDFRHNDRYLRARPGTDTPLLDHEPGPVAVRFGLPPRPSFRTLAENVLPVVTTRWELDDIEVEQTALVTQLLGMRATDPPPSGDAPAVWLARLVITNVSEQRRSFELPLEFAAGSAPLSLRLDAQGCLLAGDHIRGQIETRRPSAGLRDGTEAFRTGASEPGSRWVASWTLAAHDSREVVVKIPYLRFDGSVAGDSLLRLDFEKEHKAVTDWWRARLAAGTRLITPEPMLNEFYQSHAMHLLVNCEREPLSERRFARVGSFSYGAYGNESCMMVVDLDRRGFHLEAEQCLDAWMHYQGTVGLPGSFAGKEGVFYGAGGYEAGGYNQHHGWILWMYGEHYRFTRDQSWLRRVAPGMVRGADWILGETARTADRHPLERGLLPAGSLEDIGDWWTWLSTSCYTWRGLENAAWALEQIGHPEAARLRQGAETYHHALLRNFRAARDQSPVVRLRDGTAVPKFPSHVHRRGRCFGWICETLEGALHLLITRAIEPQSREAEWILDDYEDNLYLSNQYGYLLENFDRHWFGRGGMSMQACLLLQVEPWLFRDDVKHALRALMNAQAASYFPDVRMNTEHALPNLDDWRGDHFKSSDEANCAGWLRQLFVREHDEQTLWIGQAIPRDWLKPGAECGLERAATWFGPMSVRYRGNEGSISAEISGPTRNPPKLLRVRFRNPAERVLSRVTVNGQPWTRFAGEWVELPGDIGRTRLEVSW